MKTSYYMNIVSFGKCFTYKINKKFTGEFEIIENRSLATNHDIKFEETTHFYLCKYGKAIKATSLVECRKGKFDGVNISECPTYILQKVFATMIRLYEKNMFPQGLPLRSFDHFHECLYPMIFKR